MAPASAAALHHDQLRDGAQRCPKGSSARPADSLTVAGRLWDMDLAATHGTTFVCTRDPHAVVRTWVSGEPAFLNARGKRWTRPAIAQHVIPPSLEEANRQRSKAGLPEIREEVTPHTLRDTYIASLFAAGADQEYVADQVGHEDVTTTTRIYRNVAAAPARRDRRQLAMHESAADVGRSEDLPTRTGES